MNQITQIITSVFNYNGKEYSSYQEAEAAREREKLDAFDPVEETKLDDRWFERISKDKSYPCIIHSATEYGEYYVYLINNQYDIIRVCTELLKVALERGEFWNDHLPLVKWIVDNDKGSSAVRFVLEEIKIDDGSLHKFSLEDFCTSY